LDSDRGVAIDRKQFPITPHAVGPRFDGFSADMLLDHLVVVRGFQGAEIELADVNGFFGIESTAFAALQITKKFLAHISSLLSINEGEERRNDTNLLTSHPFSTTRAELGLAP
jgi:hypothetical protein